MSSTPKEAREATPHWSASHRVPDTGLKNSSGREMGKNPESMGRVPETQKFAGKRSSPGAKEATRDAASPGGKIPASRRPVSAESRAAAISLPARATAASRPPVPASSGTKVPGVTMRTTCRSTSVFPSGSPICSQMATLHPARTSRPR